MTHESKAYAALKNRVCRPTDRMERVENGLLAGMPDVNYCIARQEGWIEIKCPTEPKRENTALFASNHPVEIEQSNWMLRQAQAGGASFLFIVSDKRLLLIEGALVGKHGRSINSFSADQLERISKWKQLLPILDPLVWLDLREILATRP